ncbi:Phosphatidate cytidylyltransferase [Bacteroidales bacterium CF]|jgi:CDP-diglyceride synthetase|nr:Phosphatidate cytidylyltransferase [Bacteroidales bacterium CF]
MSGKINTTLVRSISGIIFLAIMVGSMFLSPIAFGAVMAFAVGLMITEYLMMTLNARFRLAQALTVTAGVTLYILVYLYKAYDIDPRWFYLMTIPISSIFISLLYYKGNLQDDTVNGTEIYKMHPFLFTSLIYIALPFSLTSFILFDSGLNYKPLLLLSMFIIMWASDVGAYVFGMLFGQKGGHKLFPSISPKKSWEGFFGGLFCGLVAGFLVWTFSLTDFSLIHNIVIALIISLTGVTGDLVESQLKRNFGAKDSGKLMPGHGGLLDRFDATLISFPLAITYIKLFSLI